MLEPERDERGESEQLVLFLAGEAPRSVRARKHLEDALRRFDRDMSVVVVVDTLRNPQRALEHRIFANPALMALPPDEAVLYGDLSNAEMLDRFLKGILDACEP